MLAIDTQNMLNEKRAKEFKTSLNEFIATVKFEWKGTRFNRVLFIHQHLEKEINYGKGFEKYV